jgi:hypothetical protein
MNKLTIAALLLFTSTFVFAEPYKTLPSASQLTADISSLGEREVLLNRLAGNEHVFESFLRSVETGSHTWLRLAAKLKGASDAGSSESLISAVSLAIVRRPENVIRLLATADAEPTFKVSDICSGRQVFIEQPIQEAKWRREAARAVARVHEPTLIETRNACLAAIRA